MRRWHQDYKVTRREWRKHRESHVISNKANSKNRVGLDPQMIDCECDEQIGRFRKKDALDCGKPQCGLCHSDKFPKRSKTSDELKSELDFKEQIKEI